MGNGSKFPNAAARHVYVEALHLEWPEILTALQDDVFPRLLQLWTERLTDDGAVYSKKYRQFDESFADKELDRALKLWARSFSIEDDWMLQNARTTMYMYGVVWRDPKLRWTGWIQSGPQHLTDRQTFDASISDFWIPSEYGGLETWKKFSDRLRSGFNEALNRYRKLQSERFGVLNDNAKRDARWTVRYQKGISVAEIAKDMPSAYSDPEQTAWKAIDRFAKDIRLTLRQTRRHRTRK